MLVACGMLQQKESQKKILKPKEENEVFAVLGRKTNLSCSNYRKSDHTAMESQITLPKNVGPAKLVVKLVIHMTNVGLL